MIQDLKEAFRHFFTSSNYALLRQNSKYTKEFFLFLNPLPKSPLNKNTYYNKSISYCFSEDKNVHCYFSELPQKLYIFAMKETLKCKVMKRTLGLLPIGVLALSACTPNDAENAHVEQLPVVAHMVDIDGQEVTVNDFNLLKDTIDLPLSFWLEDFQVVKLDSKDEALADMGPVYISDNYILVVRKNRLSPIPCKLYRKDGTYVGKVGDIGQGAGEYQDIYDVQIDEANGCIYFMPWNARSILVYNLQGKYIKNIPLNKILTFLDDVHQIVF